MLSSSKKDETPVAPTTEVSILSVTLEETNDMSIATQISAINVPFHGDNLYLVSHFGEAQVPMRPVVEGMGLDWASQFTKIKNRFKTSVVMITIQLPGDNQRREVVCLNPRKLAGWLHTINVGKVRPDLRDKVAKYQEECDDVLYQYWTKGEAKNPRKKTTVDERTPLRDAVNMLVGKKGLRYDDAYNMVHQRFAIDSIDELSLEQIPLAVEYVHRVVLEGEFIGKQQELSFSPQCSDEELVHLAWMWDYANRSQALFKEVLPGLKQMKSGYAGTFHDHAIEFSYMLNVCRAILDGMTSHIEVNKESVNTNPTVLIRLRSNSLPARYL